MVWHGTGGEMTKLPNWPNISNRRAGIGLDQFDGLWITIDDNLRQIITPQGIYLNPADFSDLLLPSIFFIDEKGSQHEVSVNSSKQLLIDDKSMNELADCYTKKEVDDLVNQQILTAPNGGKWKLNITNSGELSTIKISEGRGVDDPSTIKSDARGKS